MSANIQEFEKTTLRERVLRALRAAVVAGELEPGTVYSAPELAKRFGVSATPVREAMLDLVREGLVETVPNKGYRVTEMAESELDQITELRLLIEPSLVARAHIPDGDLSELRAMAQAIVDGAAAGDLIAYTEADRAFHLRLLEYAGNARATSLISDLRAHTRLYGLAALSERGELEESAREHHAILDAISGGNPGLVEKLMRTHIGHVRESWASAEPTQRKRKS
ncbi:GntR family transcriptional regulator [Amycolatopsis silviterrae]|uniref:GntR family transcriptional regulator n=1 Tax=Amycolatopsis silviterrae TaxID=1656914 RepID=A0ABW5HM22_9PSEU